MWRNLLLALVATVLVAAIPVRCEVGGDEDANYAGDRVVERIPVFTSQPLRKLVNQGNQIRLPCFVDHLEGFVLLWKRGDTILSVGERVINFVDVRTSIENERNGNWLEIESAKVGDAGEYTCHISAVHPKEIVHSVLIRTRPVIKPINTEVVGVEGANVTLSCFIKSGQPTPEITWAREGNRKWAGVPPARAEGPSLVLVNVTRHHAGLYTCSADNGFSADISQAEVRLVVEHRPYIEPDDAFVHSSPGQPARMVCRVHAQPPAQVEWYRGEFHLSNLQYNMSTTGSLYSLYLAPEDTSLGNYSCSASNSLGKYSKTITVSNKVGPIKFTCPPLGNSSITFPLSWLATSYSPVSRFRVVLELEDRSASPTEMVVQPGKHSGVSWSGQTVLTGLSPATLYLARVAGENAEGLGPYSQEFRFGTEGAVLELSEMSTSHTLSLSCFLTLLSLVLLII